MQNSTLTPDQPEVATMEPTDAHETLIDVPGGLVGLPEHHRYVLTAGAREGYYLLQAEAEPQLCFVLVDPFPLFHGYSVDIGPADQQDIGPFERSELLVLTVVTLGTESNPTITANLRGPIVFNLRTRQAKQLVLSDAAADLRASFDPLPAVPAAV